MKYLIMVLFCLIAQTSFASEKLIAGCAHLKSAKEAEFVLFNKKEFIQLGECIAVNFIKKQTILNLPRACEEVTENQLNPLGILSLTKLEAIYIGQCIGVINYIYQHYHDEAVQYNRRSRRNRKYSCVKGSAAVKILSASVNDENYRNDIRDLLCTER